MFHLLLDITLSTLVSVGHADNTTIATQDMGDSIIAIQTVCEPICSSVVYVFRPNGTLLHTIPAPDANAIFPEAQFTEEHTIRWTDNTPTMLDDEEKKHLNP